MNFKCLYFLNGISGFRDRFVSTQYYIFISKIISILPKVYFCNVVWTTWVWVQVPDDTRKKKRETKKNPIRIRLDKSVVTWCGPPDCKCVRFISGSENVENQSVMGHEPMMHQNWLRSAHQPLATAYISWLCFLWWIYPPGFKSST